MDELAERLAELRLALRDDRGVGDGQAERVAEQRDHGEPVGQAAHHRGLGGGLHVAEGRPGLRAGDHGGDEHHGDRGQQRGRPAARPVTSCCRLRSALGDGGSEGAVVTVAVMAAGLPAARGSLPLVADRLEGAAGLGGILGAAHRRQRLHHLPPVAGLGEPRVEDGHDAAIARSSG